MRTEEDIRKRLAQLENERLGGGPFTELENVSRRAAEQALKWALEETDSVLTY